MTMKTGTGWCETPAHGTGMHPLTPECTWPHLAGPPGPCPVLGHPLTPHD